jgi:hypothetical protein
MNRFISSWRPRTETRRPGRARPVLEQLEGRSLLTSPTLGPLAQAPAASLSPPSGVVTQAATWTTLDDPVAVNGTYAMGISGNNIVGYYSDANHVTHGFMYDGRNYKTLDDPWGNYGTQANGIDGANIVGGYHQKLRGWGGSYTTVTHGFLYDGTSYKTLDPPGWLNFNYCTGISGSSIVGCYGDRNGLTQGYLYNGSSYRTVSVPGATNTLANGISGSNIVGEYLDSKGWHGFLYNGTSYTTLNDPLATQGTGAHGISGSKIVGSYADGAGTHGFSYNGSAYTTLDDPLATQGTGAYGISGSNIVGNYADKSGYHGFLYQPGSAPVSATANQVLTVQGPGEPAVSYQTAGVHDLTAMPGQPAAMTPIFAAPLAPATGADVGITPSIGISGELVSLRARRGAHGLVSDLAMDIFALADVS